VIRYPITLDELHARIEVEAPGWLAEAARRTEGFRRAGFYDEESGIWSRIKAVYAELQHHKCAYCERRLAADDFGGSIEQDMDHYRPKAGVRRWPTPEIARQRGISYGFETGEPFPEGYHLVAYHPFNFAVTCKKCNSPLKSSFFPVAGARRQGDDPANLRKEKPFLPYPLGDLDEDPEKILTFDGISPVPRLKRGPRRRRAVVTIDFFELDAREELRRGRATAILTLYTTLELLSTGDSRQRRLARRAVSILASPAAEHTNCARSFLALYRRDKQRADEIFHAAQRYLESQSP
jgi:hypothetical protein